MSAEKSPPKMFVQIVKELREIIRVEEIEPGGKLPSERVLAERLGVGRSSVREALRSMELLGLIETKRGGGTFLADYRNHKLVEVLSTFILQEEKDVENVHDTQQILERDAIIEIATNDDLRKLPVWESLLHNLIIDGSIEREILVRELMVSSHNRLVFKIWMLLNQFGKSMHKGLSEDDEKTIIAKFLSELKTGNPAQAVQAYAEWMELLKKGRE
ncbi:FadR/GntR family transcriptional regulator [Kurthia sibirica]|uniref:FadR family transcriptional regulator n=1 Tax=Kurthia sibirica TaxID=202750 RepID=A0A2U3ANW0_9BACL|nr:GntR family transcriptional regulator [Kurthia sibirica]PWI26199.1 FadR family transcriptional regulator [Kurthia sibirica]GEK34712.1 GntR family transcriptional regulator [Kurthia sibirica]